MKLDPISCLWLGEKNRKISILNWIVSSQLRLWNFAVRWWYVVGWLNSFTLIQQMPCLWLYDDVSNGWKLKMSELSNCNRIEFRAQGGGNAETLCHDRRQKMLDFQLQLDRSRLLRHPTNTNCRQTVNAKFSSFVLHCRAVNCLKPLEWIMNGSWIRYLEWLSGTPREFIHLHRLWVTLTTSDSVAIEKLLWLYPSGVASRRWPTQRTENSRCFIHLVCWLHRSCGEMKNRISHSFLIHLSLGIFKLWADVNLIWLKVDMLQPRHGPTAIASFIMKLMTDIIGCCMRNFKFSSKLRRCILRFHARRQRKFNHETASKNTFINLDDLCEIVRTENGLRRFLKSQRKLTKFY